MIMRSLPPKGLIVSCYLESMKGCEKQFIASVAHLPEVVALRVEGLDNIRFARMIAPEQYIVGLVKEYGIDETGARIVAITETTQVAYQIRNAGADMVATDCLEEWSCVYITPLLVMYDVPQHYDPIVRQTATPGEYIIATTHTPKAFDLVEKWRKEYPEAVINLEGSIETLEEIERGFEVGADYVTIGKVINDPPTIIRRLVCG